MSRLTIQAALQLGVREHQLGRLDDALALYQHVLGTDPSNADALHLTGMVLLVKGRAAEAIGLMERAIDAATASGTVAPHFRSNLANAYRESGQLERAEAKYRAAIAAGGGTPEVFNNLGLTLLGLGRPAWAIEAFESALARRPGHAATLTNLSVACLAAGAAAEALRCADEALAQDGNLEPALLARASALAALDRRDEAHELFRTLLESSVASAALSGLSDTLFAEDRGAEAVSISERVVKERAEDPDAWMQLGQNLMRMSRISEAERAFSRCTELRPSNGAAHAQRGAMLCTLGRHAEAIEVLRHTTMLAPSHAEAWANLSTALLACRDVRDAVSAAERAVALSNRSLFTLSVLGAALLGARRYSEAHPIFVELTNKAPSADAWNGLGVSLERMGRLTEAREAYARAIAMDSGHLSACLNHAECLLLLGEYESGWRGYEARLKLTAAASARTDGVSRPRWYPGARTESGQLPRVLLVAEQGLGDAIQFARYAKVIRREAARVMLQTPAALQRVLSTVDGIDEVVGQNECREHDYAIHAMSVPDAVGTTLETIPASIPYIVPDPVLFESWRNRLGPRKGLRVAMVWAGSPDHIHDESRSVRLRSLEPLAGVAGVQWFSVQKGPGAAQLAEISSRWAVTDLGACLEDLADTAAVLANVDLVITVDTSIAHLAGALGARTWTLLSHPPEWRWLLDRRDTPWYPTMTLFRQREVDQWVPVIARVRHRLERLVHSKVQ